MSENKTIAISLIIALLMIVSTFTIGTAEEPSCDENLDTVKKVWNGTAWADSVHARVGEDVTFKTTIKYNIVNETKGFKAKNLVVNDTLPSGLEYNDNVVITYGNETYTEESNVSDNTIWWNLSEDYHTSNYSTKDGNLELWADSTAPDNVSIEFNATVIEAGTYVNQVEVNALEKCSNVSLYGEDEATVIAEPSTPDITVEKKILNSETNEWVEYAEGFHLDDIVKFKIDITWDDGGSGYPINNLVIKDQLPCCLQYIENTTEYTKTPTNLADPITKIENNHQNITWEWKTEQIFIENNQHLAFTFETNFTHYCGEKGDCQECNDCIKENMVNITGSICHLAKINKTYYDEDTANVNCCQPDPKFTKEVWNGTAWADKVEAVKGQTIEFKLELEHFGEANLTNITFYDKLPCILEYVEGSSNPTNVSDDKKRIWWNLSNLTMEDADIKTITFEAFVTGSTDCGCNEMEITTKKNCANVTGELIIDECTTETVTVEFNATVEIRSLPNCPPDTPDLRGDSLGTIGETLTFDTKTIDPDGDNVSYMFDWKWNDDEEKTWIGPYEEGNEITVTHSWDEPGTYEIRVKAKDIHGIESEWKSYTETVTIAEANVTVEMPFFHFRNITATISNNGQADLEDIEWNITVKRCRLLNMRSINISNEGTIDIPAEETGEAYTGKLPLAKIGLATVNITITADDIEPIYKQKTAILLGAAAITI